LSAMPVRATASATVTSVGISLVMSGTDMRVGLARHLGAWVDLLVWTGLAIQWTTAGRIGKPRWSKGLNNP
jgi:hypothetical protein